MKGTTNQLQSFILSLMMLVMGAAGAWADSQTIKAGTESSGDFTYSSLTAYSYDNNYWAKKNGSEVISLSNSGSFTFTNSTGATITEITIKGVAQNNGTQTSTVTITDNSSHSVTTGSTTWKSRQNTEPTSVTITTGVGDLNSTVGSTYTVSNSGYALGVQVVVTYTTSGGGGGDTPTLSSIAVKTAPTTTTYTAGEFFNPAGLVITKTMSDDSTEDVAYSGNEGDFTFSPSTSTALTTSNTSVTITYGGESTTQAITVNAAPTLYTVTFDGGGKITPGSTSITQGSEGASITLPDGTGANDANHEYTFTNWNTESDGSGTSYSAGATYTPNANITLYARYTARYKVFTAVESGYGSVVITNNSTSETIASGSWVDSGTAIDVTATPDSGYEWGDNWGTATGITTNPITNFTITDAKTFRAHFRVITVHVTGLSLNKSTTSIVAGNSETLVATVTPADATDKSVTWTSSDTDVATVSSEGVVHAVAVGTATITATSVDNGSVSATCSVTVTSATDSQLASIDFTTTPWSTSDDFSTANSGSNQTLHGVTFRGDNNGTFSIVEVSDSQHLNIENGNAQGNGRWFAIPLTGINSRLDIAIYQPGNSGFSIKAAFDAGATTVTATGSSVSGFTTPALTYNESTGAYEFRINDISATNGVLYLGRNSSSYKLLDKIVITTPQSSFTATPSSVSIADASEGAEVAILNNTPYNVIIKTAPDASVATATYNPSTSILSVSAVAKGSTSVVLVLDENGNGVADAGETTSVEVPITVTGITISAQPVSAVYETGASATALSVTASNSGDGSLSYQWYKNNVNSNYGGTAISGATESTYTPSTSETEDASFYYCVVSASGVNSVASDVAYVLTTSTRRYFRMGNVAGNVQTDDEEETVTGEIVAGGEATAINGATDSFRYVSRPNTSVAHTYVANSGTRYFKVVLDQAIQATDIISVQLNGIDTNARGIRIYDSEETSYVELSTGSDATIQTYTAVAGTALAGQTTIYIKGIYGTETNFFTELILSETLPLSVSVAPASQSIQVNENASAFVATAVGGAGSYEYQWKESTTLDGTYTNVSTGTGGNTASYTPASSASAVTKYFKCEVTDGAGTTESSSAVTYTVTALSHGYLTIDGAAHGGQTYSFVNNELKYLVNKANYDTQNITITDGQNQKFWEIERTDRFEDKTINGVTYEKTARIQRSGSNTYVNLYVKNATAFKVRAGNNASRTYDIYVDGVKVGDAVKADPAKESDEYALNSAGSKIEFKNAKEGSSGTDVHIAYIIFYEKVPASISIEDDGEAVSSVTQFIDEDKEYEVLTNSSGTVSVTSSNTGVATVSYSTVTGMFTVTPVAEGETTITVSQEATSEYSAGSATLTVNVIKHSLNFAFSYDKQTFSADELTRDATIPAAKLPVLTATLEDGTTAYTGTINYTSDDANIATTEANSYVVTYRGGQGGARIYAYVDETTNYERAVASFDLVVQNGTSNNLPNGEKIDVQEQYTMKNSMGAEVITLTYGGYKFGDHSYTKGKNTVTDRWADAKSYNKYYIDGYQYYTSNEDNDATDEYLNQVKDQTEESDNRAKDGELYYIWYQTSETKPDGTNYSEYERIRPFALPCRASYLKFEPKKTGVLTAYVVQNGIIGRGSNENQIGSRPRLGYWFDEEGWIQHPVGTVISKQPVLNGSGRDTHVYGGKNLDQQMDSEDGWKEKPIVTILRSRYCDNAANPTSYSTESDTSHSALNPYYWGLESEVEANNARVVPEPVRPVPYHNGYMVIEKGYVKYTLNVVAGKTYYFFGMMTKVGYVGMNFVENDDVEIGGRTYDHEDEMHLQNNDDMEDKVDKLSRGTVYNVVTLPSNFRKNKWNTICLPFALSESQVEEAFGKGTELTLYNGLIKKGTDYTIKYLSHVDCNILPGQPYFIKPSGVDEDGEDLPRVGEIIGSASDFGDTRISFSNVCVDKEQFDIETCNYGSNKNVNESGDDLHEEGYKFVGAYNNPTPERWSYMINVATGNLRQLTTTTSYKLNTYKAYLKPNSPAALSGSMSLHVDFTEGTIEKTWETDVNDDATEVISMEEIADALNGGTVLGGKAHNVMGQEVDPTSAKGIVIINGKKYMFE